MQTASKVNDAKEFLSRQEQFVDSVRREVAEHGLEVIIAGAADLNGIFRGKRIPAARFVEHPLASVAVSDYFWAMDTEEAVVARLPAWR